MNKIISANINGFVFSIDEAAYDKLKTYLENMRRKVDNYEVMMDIENRIAELFDYKIKNGKQAIFDQDVEDIIAQIGSPEEMSNEETDNQENKQEKQEASTSQSNRKKYRRLYRNDDDKVVGGVCSGVAAYFNIDPFYVRMAFIGMFLLFGSGILLYLIMMVIIPKAMTPAEKLEMMGEPVDFNNLSKTIEKDIRDAVDRYRPGVKTGFERFLEILVKFGAVALIIFLLFVFIPTGLGIFTAIGASFWALPVLGSYMFTTELEGFVILIGLLFFFVIPIVGGCIKILRILFKRPPLPKAITVSMTVIWFIGFCMVAYSTYNIGMNFSKTHSVSQTDTLNVRSESRLIIRATSDEDQTRFYRNDEDGDRHLEIHSEEDLRASLDQEIRKNLKLQIIRGYGQYPVIKVIKRSMGRSKADATEKALAIHYRYEIKDSLLTLDRYFQTDKEELWRNQNVKIVLEVPESMRILIDNSCKGLMDNKDFSDWDEDKDESIYGKDLRFNKKGQLAEEKWN